MHPETIPLAMAMLHGRAPIPWYADHLRDLGDDPAADAVEHEHHFGHTHVLGDPDPTYGASWRLHPWETWGSMWSRALFQPYRSRDPRVTHPEREHRHLLRYALTPLGGELVASQDTPGAPNLLSVPLPQFLVHVLARPHGHSFVARAARMFQIHRLMDAAMLADTPEGLAQAVRDHDPHAEHVLTGMGRVLRDRSYRPRHVEVTHVIPTGHTDEYDAPVGEYHLLTGDRFPHRIRRATASGAQYEGLDERVFRQEGQHLYPGYWMQHYMRDPAGALAAHHHVITHRSAA